MGLSNHEREIITVWYKNGLSGSRSEKILIYLQKEYNLSQKDVLGTINKLCQQLKKDPVGRIWLRERVKWEASNKNPDPQLPKSHHSSSQWPLDRGRLMERMAKISKSAHTNRTGHRPSVDLQRLKRLPMPMKRVYHKNVLTVSRRDSDVGSRNDRPSPIDSEKNLYVIMRTNVNSTGLPVIPVETFSCSPKLLAVIQSLPYSEGRVANLYFAADPPEAVDLLHKWLSRTKFEYGFGNYEALLNIAAKYEITSLQSELEVMLLYVAHETIAADVDNLLPHLVTLILYAASWNMDEVFGKYVKLLVARPKAGRQFITGSSLTDLVKIDPVKAVDLLERVTKSSKLFRRS